MWKKGNGPKCQVQPWELLYDIFNPQKGLPRWLNGKRTHLPMHKTLEMWVQSLGREDPLEKGTSTHFTLLARRIPWTREPGGLQFMRSQRVGKDQVIERESY